VAECSIIGVHLMEVTFPSTNDLWLCGLICFPDKIARLCGLICFLDKIAEWLYSAASCWALKVVKYKWVFLGHIL